MAKMKFKVGDRVKPTKDNGYNITGQGMEVGIVTYVGKCVFSGSDMKVRVLKHKSKELEGLLSPVESRFFEKIGRETIVIYRNENKVIALDKSTGKKAEARCNPADDFDFHYRLYQPQFDLWYEKCGKNHPHIAPKNWDENFLYNSDIYYFAIAAKNSNLIFEQNKEPVIIEDDGYENLIFL